MRYDAQELRRTARQVTQAADKIRSAGQDDVARTQNNLAGRFRGKAADALEGELSSLRNDLQQLASGLAAVSAELLAYARRLEQADADAARAIKSQ